MFSKKDIKPGMLVELSVWGEKKLHYVTLYKEGIVLIDKELCPECGEPLIATGGCKSCSSCAWSRCE